MANSQFSNSSDAFTVSVLKDVFIFTFHSYRTYNSQLEYSQQEYSELCEFIQTETLKPSIFLIHM